MTVSTMKLFSRLTHFPNHFSFIHSSYAIGKRQKAKETEKEMGTKSLNLIKWTSYFHQAKLFLADV